MKRQEKLIEERYCNTLMAASSALQRVAQERMAIHQAVQEDI
ncbi:hypothetical protein [Ammoniphilus sp. 3BR4]